MTDLTSQHLLPEATATHGLEVHNPADGSLIGFVRSYEPEDVPALVAKSAKAQKAWAVRPAKERSDLVRKWFELVIANGDEIASIITSECGKPIVEAKGEVKYGASFIEWFAEEARRTYGDVIPSMAGDKRILTMKQPVGVCAAITPWNFPLAMVTRKVAPALAAGCSILLKPAELTPITSLVIEQLAIEAGIPEGLFITLPTNRPSEVGKVLCEHPTVRKLSFTGSTAVGKLLMAQCSSTLKRLSLELGGNAPFIVFDDADLDAAIDGLMASKFRNAGQTCVCANRVLVQDGVYDAFREKVVARTAALHVGDGANENSQIGPLISDRALGMVTDLVETAKKQGATVLAGAEPHALGGQFYTPTVLDDVVASMEIANLEIFGPVVSLMRFKDEGEAIRIANETPYGLAAYFYARDIGRIWRVTEQLEYGMVASNDGVLSTEVAPFGGIKESGFGREGSKYGLDEYLEIKYSLMSGLSS